MRYFQILKVAYKALGRNKMRSSLTMLGIIIGVAAVIAMLGIGQCAKKMVNAQIASLGDNLLNIFPGSFMSGGMRAGAGTRTSLTEEDAKAIKEKCPAVLRISPVVRTGAQVVAGNLNWGTSIEGYSTDFPLIRSWPLASGTFFTEQDVKGATKVCILGKTVVDNLFAGQDPIGEIIRIKKLPFRVIGVLSSKGQNAFGRDQDGLDTHTPQEINTQAILNIIELGIISFAVIDDPAICQNAVHIQKQEFHLFDLSFKFF